MDEWNVGKYPGGVENEYVRRKKDSDSREEEEIHEVEKQPAPITSSMESSVRSADVVSPQLDSGYATVENGSCDRGYEQPDVIPSVVIPEADAQETDIPSASSDYGSADFDYTFGDDRRFAAFDASNQPDFTQPEHQDADVDIGAADWTDQAIKHFDWPERKHRMWTTVFNEEEEKIEKDEQKHERSQQEHAAADSAHGHITAISRS
ncbi:unnamed protein product [Gongylonema pulchrum]|uniref:Btz domain-containing protein n=1 Tax=Gongylonema pulchrum TaxID=637853 RepID=A0A183CYL7_9BILA|nr:unnamed protein product [Gongylonema pulchrum]